MRTAERAAIISGVRLRRRWPLVGLLGGRFVSCVTPPGFRDRQDGAPVIRVACLDAVVCVNSTMRTCHCQRHTRAASVWRIRSAFVATGMFVGYHIQLDSVLEKCLARGDHEIKTFGGI